MRLIHTIRLELHEFFDAQIPEYAILSHCWGKDEVTYQQFLAGKSRDAEGWRKIVLCCQLARDIDLEWAWVDTCCIDKTSTAELSEAINSMYNWYKKATRCFALLPETLGDHESQKCCKDAETQTDVEGGWETASASSDGSLAVRHSLALHTKSQHNTSNVISHLGDSRWFTRGWALQELLASPSAFFYDRDIKVIGTTFGLRRQLADITGIGVKYLEGTRGVHEASVACRMSWAANRTTTRGEDIAYCLLGIFDINMPLLYGEGSTGAFAVSKKLSSRRAMTKPSLLGAERPMPTHEALFSRRIPRILLSVPFLCHRNMRLRRLKSLAGECKFTCPMND